MAKQPGDKTLVFLDPDTGIEPLGSAKNEHLLIKDIVSICSVLRPGDKVVIYQHALHSANWMNTFSQRLNKIAVDTQTELGDPFHSPGVAKTSAFSLLLRGPEGAETKHTPDAGCSIHRVFVSRDEWAFAPRANHPPSFLIGLIGVDPC